MHHQHYVFGYGSLICAESRAATASALGADDGDPGGRRHHDGSIGIPVRLNNWVRLWNLRGPNTYLGVQTSSPESESSCVGVLVPLPPSSTTSNNETNDDGNGNDDVLEALDRRERGYNRHSVDLGSIERVDDLLLTANTAEDEHDATSYQAVEDLYYKHTFLRRTTCTAAASTAAAATDRCQTPNGTVCIWIYVPKDRYAGMACPRTPILQSYVDICLRGCLSISEPFAREFVESTYGWYPGHGHLELTGDATKNEDSDEDSDDNSSKSVYCCWINDRETPVYIRADKKFSIDNSELLDEIFDPVLLGRRR